MSNPNKETLQRLLHEYKETGDETLILELFDSTASLKRNNTSEFDASNSSFINDQDDTMAFAQVFNPNSEDSLSQTSPTFDETNGGTEIGTRDFLHASSYEQTGILGAGGMGTVLQVQDPTLKRTVAMKVLHSQHSTLGDGSFLAEAQISALLQHPSIIPIYEFGTVNETPYFTMQEIRGQSLKMLLRQPERPSLHELISILHTVTKAMEYAHNLGVVHRDLKPSNILVGEFGEVYVVDWGIAVILPQSSHRHPGLHPSLYLDPVSTGIVGTVGYMSPEQAAGKNDSVSSATDIFALGSILFEILTGTPILNKSTPKPLLWKQQLFECEETQATFRTHILNSMTTNTGLESLYADALEPNYERRNLSTSRFGKSLQQWLNGAIKRQTAQGHYDSARVIEAEIKVVETQISELIASYPKDNALRSYNHYCEILSFRQTKKEKVRAQEQELHRGLLHAPDFTELHEGLIALEFDSYKRMLKESKYEIAEDLYSKLQTRLSVLDSTTSKTWDDKLNRCHQSHQLHTFGSPFFASQDAIDSLLRNLHISKVATIFGSPGSGKSRLAVEACREQYIEDGIPFHVVSCHDYLDIEDVYSALAFSLDIELKDLSLNTLYPVLKRLPQTCFVLDGVDTIQESLAAFIDEMNQTSSDLLFVVTTRNSKTLPAGYALEVPELSRVHSIDLFAWQGKKSRASFRITEKNFSAISAILECVQHSPLNVEMVSQKLAAYTLFELHEKLKTQNNNFTLDSAFTDTIEWSWGLLSERSKIVLIIASYFTQSFTLSGIQVVLNAFAQLEPHDTPELLQDLIEQGLLHRTQSTHGIRYNIPYVLRSFASSRQSQFEKTAEHSWSDMSKHFVAHCQGNSAQELRLDLQNLYSIAYGGTEQHHFESALLCANIWIRVGPWSEGCRRIANLARHFADVPFAEQINLEYGRLLRLSGDTSQALQIITNLRAKHLKAHRALELALLHQIKTDYAMSTECAQEVVSCTSGDDEQKLRLHAQLIIGINNNLLRQYDSARRIFVEIEEPIKALNDLPLTIQLYSHLCANHLECAEHNEAQNVIEKGLWYTKQGHYPKEQSDLYFQLAKIKVIQGFHREGLPIAHQALELSRSIGDIHNEARILLTIGVCHNKMQEYKTAKHIYEEAMDCYRSIDNLRGEVLVIINLCQIYPKLSLHSDMNRLFTWATQLGEQLGDKRVLGLIHSNRANYFASVGKFTEALESYDLSKIFHADINHQKGQTIALSNRAFVLWQKKETEAAVRTFEEALDASKRLELNNNTVVLLGNYATLLLEVGEEDKAFKTIQECLELAGEIHFNMAVTFFSSILATLYSKQNKHALALQTFDQYAIEQLRDTEQYVLYTCSHTLCWLNSGNIAKARETFESMSLEHQDLSEPTMWRVRKTLFQTKKSLEQSTSSE